MLNVCLRITLRPLWYAENLERDCSATVLLVFGVSHVFGVLSSHTTAELPIHGDSTDKS